MSDSGMVLAAFVQAHLAELDASGDASREVRERLEGRCLERLETSPRIAWIPIPDHVQLTEAIQAALGEATARDLCRRMLLRSFEQPFLRPLFHGAVAIAGGSLERFAAWAPRSWPALYRDGGRLRWESEGSGSGRMLLAGAPACMRQSPAYVSGLAGAFSALLDVTRCSGTVEPRVEGVDIVLHFSWEASRRRSA